MLAAAAESIANGRGNAVVWTLTLDEGLLLVSARFVLMSKPHLNRVSCFLRVHVRYRRTDGQNDDGTRPAVKRDRATPSNRR